MKLISTFQSSTDFSIEKWYNSAIKTDNGQFSCNADKKK